MDDARKEAAKGDLTRSLQKKQELLIETELAAVMKDAYPKAQYHFLVVPKEDTSNVTALTADHLQLLDHMNELANQIIEQQNDLPPSHFLIGFKIDAFMNRLCMHVISNDFYSESMRRKEHWNSFNTALFLTYQTVYALLRVQGFIEPMPEEETQKLRKSIELRCNQCDFVSDRLVALKAHLFMHWKEREGKFRIKHQMEKLTRKLDETKLTPIAKVLEDQSQRIVPSKAQPENSRQSMQKEDQQSPPPPNSNTFEKHFQRTASHKPAGFVKHQLNPDQHAPNWQRANQNSHVSSNNSVFNQQFQHFPNYRVGYAPNNVNIPHQALLNAFKQYPNMRQGVPNRFRAPRYHHMPNKQASHTRPQTLNNINEPEGSPALNIKQQGNNYSKTNIQKSLGSQQVSNPVNHGQNPAQTNNPKSFKKKPSTK